MPALADDAPVEDQPDLVGAANVEVVVQDLLKKIRPDTGRSSIWVSENSACRIDGS
jgi:hypothetical protein